MRIIKSKYLVFTMLLLLFSKYNIAQSPGRIDINNRITYSFPIKGELNIKQLSTYTNVITGQYQDLNETGIVIAKTYMDSVIWTKKYQSTLQGISIVNAIQLPDNTIVANSASYVGNNFMLARFKANGNLLWIKKYSLPLQNFEINVGNQTNNSIVYNNGYIYISTIYSGIFYPDEFFNIVAKLDLDGNPIWTTTLRKKFPVVTESSDPPMIIDDTVTVIANSVHKSVITGRTDSLGTVITRLDANTGNIISATEIKTPPDKFIKGTYVVNAKIFKDKSICLTGVMGEYYPDGTNISKFSYMPFVLKLDADLNFIAAKHFVYPIFASFQNYGFGNYTICINNNKQTGFLLRDAHSNLIHTLIIDSNLTINRTRVFYPNAQVYFGKGTFNLDDDVTSIYGFSNYKNNQGQTELEYFRINNLIPTNTIDCFGRDTSVFVTKNFTTLKDSFIWDIQMTDNLIATPLTLVEKPITITKETICTQTSICDSIKIKGETEHCLSNPNASFTIYKNPKCIRKTYWQVDTTAIKIIDQPNDSVINVQFIKPFHGYIKAAFEGCVLKDSLYINVYPLIAPLFLGKDTTLCPGQSITLNGGPGFKTYKWQDNSSSSTFIANKPGTYYLQVTDSCNNVFRDTIIINPLEKSLNLSYQNTLCLSDTAMIALDSRFQHYTWSPQQDGIIQNNVLKLFPKISTSFQVSAQPFYGCTVSNTLFVKVEICPEYVYLPTAFTPNNDGLNDIFKPIVSGHIEQYKFLIYNRYGQQIFSSQKINEGWDGAINGMPQDAGAFTWVCFYKFRNGKKVLKKGSVILIR